jgi:hypothetical protein
MTDPRELAQDFLDMSEDYEIQTLARELLKALNERDRLLAVAEAAQTYVYELETIGEAQDTPLLLALAKLNEENV